MSKAAGFAPGGYHAYTAYDADRRLQALRAEQLKKYELINEYKKAVGNIGPVNAAKLLFKDLGMTPAMVTGNDDDVLYNFLQGGQGKERLNKIKQYAAANPLIKDDASGAVFEKIYLPDGRASLQPVAVNEDGTITDPISGIMQLARNQAMLEGEAMTADQVKSLINNTKHFGYEPMGFTQDMTPYERAVGHTPQQGVKLTPQEYESMAAANLLQGVGYKNVGKDWYRNASEEARKNVLRHASSVEYNGQRIPWDQALRLEQQRLQNVHNQPQVARKTPEQWLNEEHPNYDALRTVNDYARKEFAPWVGDALKAYNSPFSDTFGRDRSMLFDLVAGPRMRGLSERESDMLRGAGGKQIGNLKSSVGSRYDNVAGQHIENLANKLHLSQYLPQGMVNWNVPGVDGNTWYGKAINTAANFFNPIGTAADLPGMFVRGAGKVVGAIPHAHGNITNKVHLDNLSRAYTGTDMGLSSGAIQSQFRNHGDVNNRWVHYGIAPAADIGEGILNAYTFGKGGGRLLSGLNRAGKAIPNIGKHALNFTKHPVSNTFKAIMSPYDVAYAGGFVPGFVREGMNMAPSSIKNPDVPVTNLGQVIRNYIPLDAKTFNIYSDPKGGQEHTLRRVGNQKLPAGAPGQAQYTDMINFKPSLSY